MPWARLDDDFHDNGKILSLSHPAFRLYVCAITYCRRHRGAGHLTADQVAALCRQQRVPRPAVAELVAKRAWHADAGGYRIHDFAAYQPRDDETAADRMRRYRERRKTPSGPVTVTQRNANVTRNGDAPVPMPMPIPVTHAPPASMASSLKTDMEGDPCIAAASPPPRARASPAASPARSDFAARRVALSAALGDALGFPAQSAGERRRLDAAATALARADPPVVPGELPGMKAAWEANYDVRCTPWALADHVGELRQLATGPPATVGQRRRAGAEGDRFVDEISIARARLDGGPR